MLTSLQISDRSALSQLSQEALVRLLWIHARHCVLGARAYWVEVVFDLHRGASGVYEKFLALACSDFSTYRADSKKCVIQEVHGS